MLRKLGDRCNVQNYVDDFITGKALYSLKAWHDIQKGNANPKKGNGAQRRAVS